MAGVTEPQGTAHRQIQSAGPPSSAILTPQAPLPHVSQTAPWAPTARPRQCRSHRLGRPSLWLRIVKPYPPFKAQLKFPLSESSPFSTPAKPGDDSPSQVHTGCGPCFPRGPRVSPGMTLFM